MVFLFSALVFLAGLGAGFLINLVSTRLAANRRMLAGGLGCTRSPHKLAAWQAIPLAGYAAQRGACATCGKRLPVSYPLIELLTAGLMLSLFLLEGWGVAFLFHAAYAAILMLVLVLDWKHRDIYLSVIAAGSGLAIVGSLFIPGAGPVNALIAMLVAGGFFLAAYLAARLIFRHVEEPLGLGDVFLALMMGLMLGFPDIVGALLIGPLIAGAAAIVLLLARRHKLGDLMPYGVALCAASILFLVYPAPLAQALNLPRLVEVLSGFFG